MSIDVTSELLVAIVAAVIAALFDWFPGVAGWYDKLAPEKKRLLMAGLLTLASVIIFIGGCANIFHTAIACNLDGAIVLVGFLLEAVAVNQGFHALTKPSKSKG